MASDHTTSTGDFGGDERAVAEAASLSRIELVLEHCRQYQSPLKTAMEAVDAGWRPGPSYADLADTITDLRAKLAAEEDETASWKADAAGEFIKRQAAEERIRALEAGLEAARQFIADEYADARASALEGEPLAKTARPVFATICSLLSSDARGVE
jgi:hypothetical protein